MSKALRAPFPYFGGKSRVADVVWRAFGDVPNFVEPFFGSGAVLFARPHAPGVETANDKDCYLANLWRAIAADPEAVAHHADWPVNEADLHARHLWLVRQAEFRERMKTEPEFYDAKVAGWWVWGLCSWIGTGWCAVRGRGEGRPSQQLPHLGNAGMGVHRKLPHLGDAGRGEASPSRQLPNLGNGNGNGGGALARSASADLFLALSERLRRVRVACGDWTRVTGDSVTFKHGVTGVFLDPPYDDGAVDYSAGGGGVAAEVRAWAQEHGANPKLRIALCGYEGDPDMPGWTVHAWKAKGGYANQGDGENKNAERERVWFSPHCLSFAPPKQLSLLGAP